MQVSERVMAPSVGDPDAELVQPHCRKCDHQLAAFVALPWSIGRPSCHAPNVAGQIPSETQGLRLLALRGRPDVAQMGIEN